MDRVLCNHETIEKLLTYVEREISDRPADGAQIMLLAAACMCVDQELFVETATRAWMTMNRIRHAGLH